MGETKLDETTVNAQKEEEERKKRLAERERERAAGVTQGAPNLTSLLTSKTGCILLITTSYDCVVSHFIHIDTLLTLCGMLCSSWNTTVISHTHRTVQNQTERRRNRL